MTVPVERPRVQEILRDVERAVRTGGPQEAIRKLESLPPEIQMHPRLAMARGVCLAELGEFEKAMAVFQEASAAEPRNPDAHYNLGLCLDRTGNAEGAIAAWRHTLHLKPDHRFGLVNLGAMLLKLNRLDEAIEELGKGVEIYPRDPAFRDMLANALLDVKEPEEAVKHCKVLEEISPSGSKVIHLKGRMAHAQDRVEEAIGYFRQAVAKEPANFGYRASLASALASAQQIDEAAELQIQLCAEQPDQAEQFYALGYTLWIGRRWDEAQAAFERAVAINPQFAGAHFTLSFLYLSAEDYERGTEEFQWRWQQRTPIARRPHSQPLWQGEDLGGKRLLVWKEQGVGDEICHAAWLPLLVEDGVPTVLECDARLAPLFARSFPEVEVVPAFDPPLPATESPDIAYQVPAGDLITRLCHWERSWAPVDRLIHADPSQRAAFEEKLSQQGDGPKIGVSWYSKKPRLGLRKTCPLDQWGPILARDAVFVNLQYGPVEQEFEEVCNRFGARGYNDPDLDRFDDIDGLAALIDSLDVVVTVSNVTAHIAGALGKPTLLMLGLGSLWYWRRSGERVIPYPSVRAFRAETREDWENVIADVGQFLDSSY